MTTAVSKVLVIGGGISGMAAAIQLRKAGIDVDLVEIDPAWQPLGAGITVSGATLRALETLGVYPEVVEHGWSPAWTCTPSTAPRSPTAAAPGRLQRRRRWRIMRPVLADILARATRAASVDVRLGCTFTTLEQDATGVTVGFTDGSRRRYDLVIGADGVHSKLRALLFPEVKPLEYIGQGVWRAVMPRPAEVVRPRMWFAQHIKLGVNPVSKTHMYMFITEDRPTKGHIDESTWPQVFAGLMRPFTDPLVQALIPRALEPEAAIDYRPLANLLVPAPWNRGRVVMIGDTVAATTPHLASGAGIGIESGIVLAEELGRHGELQTALDGFHARRWERCRLVIHNSERLCRIEIEGGDKQEHARIMRESIAALAQPI
jgi:2-polyprenyl-6-methoxyphenol hydroxylase-like FAD-dependent oxidoreductase